MPFCRKCETEKPASEFYNNDENGTRCKPCVIQAARSSMLKNKYGMTEQDYEEMLNAQNGVCAICGGKQNNPRMKYMCIDHCHMHGHVRALLCQECNFFLGKLERELPRIKRFIDYIHDHSNPNNSTEGMV